MAVREEKQEEDAAELKFPKGVQSRFQRIIDIF
jgi:hypothetical protein